jgi:hypothetical protein
MRQLLVVIVDYMRIFATIMGSLGTLALLIAMVQSMLITRNSRNLLSTAVSVTVRFLAQMPLRLLPTYRGRDRWLSFVAPVTLLLQLAVYAVLFILTLGLMMWGTTTLTWNESLYQAGSTFTTLGIVEPVNAASAAISFLAAFLGLVVIAVFIGYLMAIYGMYANREAVMARVSTFSGVPAWGPEFIARSSRLGKPIASAPNTQLMLDWISQLRLNQEINPILAEFRSTYPNRHWLISLVAVLDAVSLRLAFGKSDDIAGDIQLLTEGAITLGISHGVHERNWDIESALFTALKENVSVPPSLSDEEWSAGWTEMTLAGATTGLDESTIRSRFESLRSTYIQHALPLAIRYHAVRAPWTGERTPATPILWPEITSKTYSEKE